MKSEAFERDSKTKLYVVVRNDVALGYQATAIAHGPLSCYMKVINDYMHPYHGMLGRWSLHSFRKVVCSATPEEFERIKNELGGVHVITESSLLVGPDGGTPQEVALVLMPRWRWPDYVKSLPLFGALQREVADEDVLNVWKSECDEDCESHGDVAEIHPNYYETNGEPSCGTCGKVYSYSHTVVKR